MIYELMGIYKESGAALPPFNDLFDQYQWRLQRWVLARLVQKNLYDEIH